MAVFSSFVHDATTMIPPSQIVNFTDTSTGSPNNWLWDFGDGSTSNLQNPEHTFTGAVLDTFNVTLTAWLQVSETSLTMAAISGSGLCTEKTAIGVVPPDREAEFASAPFNLFSATQKYVTNMTDTNADPGWREIRGARTQWSQTPTTNALKIPMVRVPLITGDAFYNRYPRGLAGNCYLMRSAPGTWPGSFGAIASQSGIGVGRSITFDLSPWRGVPSWFMVTSTEIAIAADVLDTQERGFMGFPVQAYDFDIASADNVNASIQQLTFGAPPIASFTGSPLQGANPLTVAFVNTSIEAIGLPTTWSWSKRLSGSGGAFVEFSTSKNPTKIFTK